MEGEMPDFPFDFVRDILANRFRDRWQIADWAKWRPWWRKPANCRILMYGDSGVALSGGSFQGLTYVKTLLESHAYYYVKFAVDFCNRDGFDPSATVRPGQVSRLTDLDIMNKYDEIWFFGLNSGASLNAAELTLIDQFMSAPKYGGVLTTGDHFTLGQGLSGQIKRVGQLRQYPAPPSSAPDYNTTMVARPGETINYPFDNQSDDIPQRIRYKRYWAGPLFRRPHPVLCGPDGPIDVLPDHQHEGEALAPAVAGDANWPTAGGHQEAPEVIAWGRIKDPGATKAGQEIGVISAYNGHMSDVGRIVADSTWHHWFDINLIGLAGSPPPYTGFDDTVAGQAALKKIDAYFLNVGVWLAPPAVQSAMRLAAWWWIIWSDLVVELDTHASLRLWGRAGIDALGRQSSRCAVFDWIVVKEPIFKPKIPWWEWVQDLRRFELVDLPIEDYVAGGILHEISHTFGPHSDKRSIVDKPPSDKELLAAIDRGTDKGIRALGAAIEREFSAVQKLAQSARMLG
jgi:hypothetical protein